MWRRISHLFYSSRPAQSQVASGTIHWEATPFVTFVLGGPGSGKGTQCAKVAKTFGFTHISAGELLRQERASNPALDAKIFKTINEGRIVPSEVTVNLLRREMESSENDKFLIDGFPRNEENRDTYQRMIGFGPDMVIFLDCPEEEMVARVLQRNQGREDDNKETVEKRIKVFTALSLPVIRYYSEKDKLFKIDGTGTTDEVFERVRPLFAALTR